MRLSVPHGPWWRSVLAAVCLAATPMLVGCPDQAPPPRKIDPEEPLVKRPRKPDAADDSPFRNPAEHPPEGREGEQVPEAEIEAILAKANTERAENRASAAIQTLLACANKTPASARCDGELGLVMADIAQRKAEALYYLQEAARTDDPKAGAALYMAVAEQLRKRGQPEDAVTAAERGLARESTVENRIALARLLQMMPEQLDRAADELGRAFAENGDHELLFEQATVLGQIRDSEHAARAAALFEKYLAEATIADEQRKALVQVRIGELQAMAKAKPKPAKAEGG